MEMRGLGSKPSVKQHLAAIRMLGDCLVTGGVLAFNPVSAVRGPKYVVKRGKTRVLDDGQMQQLLDSIDSSTPVGLRDRAVIATMVYDFARIGAVLAMNVEDYYQQGKRWWFRFHEKGGKRHDLPAHHITEVETIATGRGIRDLARLRKRYGSSRWRKLKGVALVRIAGGRIRRA